MSRCQFLSLFSSIKVTGYTVIRLQYSLRNDSSRFTRKNHYNQNDNDAQSPFDFKSVLDIKRKL